jgi:hypothetical protein
MPASIENNATTKKCFTPPTGLNIVKGAGVLKKPLPNFNISDFENNSDEVIQLNESGTLEKYDHLRITKEKDIPKPDPIITIAGAKVAVAGNITSISAESKAGKTAVCGVILAGAISKTGIIDGFNDLVVKPNKEGKAVHSS